MSEEAGTYASEQELQIRYEDSFAADGKRHCTVCEAAFPPEEMFDDKQDGYIYKTCIDCTPMQTVVLQLRDRLVALVQRIDESVIIAQEPGDPHD